MSQFDDRDDPEKIVKSRTAIKQEMNALQDLGREIVELSDKHIARLPLQGKLAEAVQLARVLKHREGRRRQLQYIGRLMREADNIEEIKAAFDKVTAIGREQNRILHQAEQWRERLLGENSQQALPEFIETHPHADIQYLRQLLRNAQKEQSQQKPPASARKLFRYIRELIEADIAN